MANEMHPSPTTPARQRVFLLHAESYAVGVIAALRRKGIDVVLCTTRGTGSRELYQAALDPGTVQLYSTEARFGQVPRDLPFAVPPARADDLLALAPRESWVMQTLDRMNVDGRSVYDLRQRYIQMVGLWRAFFDVLKPDAVMLSSGAPQFGFDLLACEMARHLGKKTLLFRGTYLEHQVMPTLGMLDVPGPTPHELAEAPASDGKTSYQTPSNEALNRQAMNLKEIREKLSNKSIARLLVGRHMFGRISPQPWFLDEPAPRHLTVRKQHFLGRLACKKALQQYDALVRSIDLDRKFVYFPLHTVPEEGTLPLGGMFSDSLHVIRTIAAGLPNDYVLVVREHANQFNHKYLMDKGRGRDFYQRLGEIDNVVCAPLEMPGSAFIEKCRAVATISGTSGWEGLQLSKPALVFGFPWYSQAPGVVRVTSDADVSAAVARIEAGEQLVEGEMLRRYERLMRTKYTRKLIYSTEFLPWAQMTQDEHDEAYADTTAAMLRGVAL